MSIRKNLMIGWLLIALAVLVVGGSTPGFAQNAPLSNADNHLVWQLPGAASTYKDTPFARGEILVGFHRDQVRSAALLASMDVQFVEAIDLRGLDGAEGDAGVDGQLLRVPEGREWEAINQLLQNPAIAFAVPNWMVQAADLENTKAEQPQTEIPFSVNDPLYAERQWYLQRVNASRAWSLSYASDGFSGKLTTVRVAIVDSGIDMDHPEFKGHILDGYNYLTSGATKPIDDYGHGTHVAGLIGATLNNSVGIASLGIKVEFVPYKVLDRFGSGSIANVAKAIRAAADNKAKIINLSLEVNGCTGINPGVVLESAIKYAYSKGVLLIAAAGNSGCSSVAFPAAYPEVMAVAATNYNDYRASYSNMGAQVAIAAPGGESSIPMLSTWPGGVYCNDIQAKLPQSGYCTSAGTSMAAAVVSGAAALVMSVRPAMTADQVRQLLLSTAAPLNEDATRVGSGRLDIDAALHQLLPADLSLISPNNITRNLGAGTEPYSVTVRLDNPSLAPITWHAKLDHTYNWVSIQQAITGTITGTVRYGAPATISLAITPTTLLTGSYIANLQVIGTRADKSSVTQTIAVSLFISTKPIVYFLPIIFQGTLLVNNTAYPDYHWETPAKATDRTMYNMADSDEISVTLPTTFTLRDKAYTNLSLFSDGYVVFPGGSSGATTSNVCLPQVDQVQQAIYGWWADLNPGVPEASVSTFRLGGDRFVIEYQNVPTAVDNLPAYTVTFQIVLYTNGDVRLNYQQVPDLQTAPPHVTIGLEASDGRFHNQVVCKDDVTELGFLPGANQSVLLNIQGDVY